MMNSGLKAAAAALALAGTMGLASTAVAHDCNRSYYPASNYGYSYASPYTYSSSYSYPTYSSGYYYPASSYSYGYGSGGYGIDSNVLGAGLLGLGVGYALGR